jgi:GxxExxY protein
MCEHEISRQILDAAIAVHKELGGPGLLESCYEAALVQELKLRGLSVARQQPVQLIYKGVPLDETYRIDLIVEDKVIVECKAVDRRNPVFAAQLLTYLRITGLRLGVVVNFGADRIVNGFERVVNNL